MVKNIRITPYQTDKTKSSKPTNTPLNVAFQKLGIEAGTIGYGQNVSVQFVFI